MPAECGTCMTRAVFRRLQCFWRNAFSFSESTPQTSRPPATNIASDAHFADPAANRLDHLKFVGIYNLDLSLVTHERRDANVGQRRSELHVVGSELPGGTPVLKRVPGIKQ